MFGKTASIIETVTALDNWVAITQHVYDRTREPVLT